MGFSRDQLMDFKWELALESRRFISPSPPFFLSSDTLHVFRSLRLYSFPFLQFLLCNGNDEAPRYRIRRRWAMHGSMRNGKREAPWVRPLRVFGQTSGKRKKEWLDSLQFGLLYWCLKTERLQIKSHSAGRFPQFPMQCDPLFFVFSISQTWLAERNDQIPKL